MVADIVRLSADHANSTITKTTMADLDITLLANTIYVFEYQLRATANAATVGIQYAIRFSGTVTRLDAMLEYWASASAWAAPSAITGATTSPQNFNVLTSAGNIVQANTIRGVIEVGASGGVLGLDHGSETATLTTVQRGSYGVASPV